MADLGPTEGLLELKEGLNLEQALDDLEGFSHIWLVGIFDRAEHWKPKIRPPRGYRKVGCLASRSPHRPNPISLSLVPLVTIEGRKVWIGHHDLLDGTPILDIKPYIDAYDRLEGTRSGWTDRVDDPKKELQISALAQEQFNWLSREGLDLLSLIRPTLTLRSKPGPNNRIKPMSALGDNVFQLAVKSWRVNFESNDVSILILSIKTGYLPEVITGEVDCPWDDLPLHIKFLASFGH